MDDNSFEQIDYDPFALGPVLEKTIPTTAGQREIWISAKQGTEPNCAYNEAAAIRLKGSVRPEKVRQAICLAVARHESLRASFSADGTSMCIAESVEPDILDLDLTRDPAGASAAYERLRENESVTPFDLEKGPLFRSRIVTLADNEYVLLLVAHHGICDGWSLDVLIEEIVSLYAGLVRDGSVLRSAAAQYSDFERALNEGANEGQAQVHEQYWKARLKTPPASLSYAFDFPAPTRRTFDAKRYDRMLSGQLRNHIREFGASSRVSLFSTVLSAYVLALGTYGRRNSLLVGIPIAGQPLVDLNDCIGHCVSFLPILAEMKQDMTFSQLAGQVQGAVLDARDNHLCTYGTILENSRFEREPGRPPLVQACFTHTHRMGGERMSAPGVEISYDFLPRSFETFELYLNLVEEGNSLQILCHYNRNLFMEKTVERLIELIEHILLQACVNPELRLDHIDFLPPDQKNLLNEWNQTQCEIPNVTGTYELVKQSARTFPEKVAVEGAGVSRTYRQLLEDVAAMRARLENTGLSRGELVGISLQRTPQVVSTILALWELGCAYVPLDPEFPAERIAYMVADSGMRLIVTQSSLRERFEPLGKSLLCTDASKDDPLLEGIAAVPRIDQPLAYVMYTSGSTGKPKGVMIGHHSLINFLMSMKKKPGMTHEDTVVAVTTISFDISLLELFLPLISGARLVIAERPTVLDGEMLKMLLNQTKATMMQATPTTWRMLVEADWSGGPQFKALCGGEAMPVTLREALTPRCGELWNMYGPTETTVWSSCFLCGADDTAISIGDPIDNTFFYILDEQMRRVPVGVAGLLYIGGEGLACGYLNRDELTAERFVDDPFSGEENARMYNTGDICRLGSDGTLHYCYRNDNQVKVRGFRIELGEIDAVLRGQTGISQVATVLRTDNVGETILVTCFVPQPQAEVTEGRLKEYLRGKLPPYMIPTSFIPMEQLPLTPNGKIDAKALAATPLIAPQPSAASFVASNNLEQKIGEIWLSVLGVSNLSTTDNFFDAGGTSMTILHVKQHIRKRLGMEIPVAALFQNPTVRALAAYLGDDTADETAATLTDVKERADMQRAALQRKRNALRRPRN